MRPWESVRHRTSRSTDSHDRMDRPKRILMARRLTFGQRPGAWQPVGTDKVPANAALPLANVPANAKLPPVNVRCMAACVSGQSPGECDAAAGQGPGAWQPSAPVHGAQCPGACSQRRGAWQPSAPVHAALRPVDGRRAAAPPTPPRRAAHRPPPRDGVQAVPPVHHDARPGSRGRILGPGARTQDWNMTQRDRAPGPKCYSMPRTISTTLSAFGPSSLAS